MRGGLGFDSVKKQARRRAAACDLLDHHRLLARPEQRAHAGVGAKTANGSIRVGEVVRGSVVIETAAGGLDVGIRPGTVAWVDADSRFGRVHNTLGATGSPDPSEEAVEIRARTAYGDIVIHRA